MSVKLPVTTSILLVPISSAGTMQLIIVLDANVVGMALCETLSLQLLSSEKPSPITVITVG